MKRLTFSFVLAVVLSADLARSAESEEQIRATFTAFVKAQNAHDLKAVEALLLDSPSFLWITRGNVVWGRAEALKRFEGLYSGTWHLEPDLSNFRVVLAQGDVAQIFVPIDFSIGPAGQPAQNARFFINQVLVKIDNTWRVASILPIPVAAPPPPSSKQ